MAGLHLKSETGHWTPLGFLRFWRPAVARNGKRNGEVRERAGLFSSKKILKKSVV